MFTEDLTEFFDVTYGFALTATKQDATTATVIKDEAFLQAHDMVTTTNPVALAKASDFNSTDDVGDTLVISSVTYKIRDVQPQDDGALVLLQLEKQ